MRIEVLERLPEVNSMLPPLLFIHGASHGAWCWQTNFLPYFSSKGFSSYAISFRGHGRSEGREKIDSFSLKDYEDDVFEVMQSFRNKPVLIGHSVGGVIVQKILHKHPNEVQAAVLMSSIPPNGLSVDSSPLNASTLKELNQLFLFNKGEPVAYPIDLILSKGLSVTEREQIAELLQPESTIVLKECTDIIISGPIATEVPLLVLGSKEDHIISEKTTFRIAEIYKTQPEIFRNISHDMMLDPNWKDAADKILSFLHGLYQ